MDNETRTRLAQQLERDTAELTTLTPTTAWRCAAMGRLERRINRAWRLLATLQQTAPPEGRG